MLPTLKLEEAAKRDANLNCHICEENKDWLAKLSEELGRPMGEIADEIFTHVRTTTKTEKKK